MTSRYGWGDNEPKILPGSQGGDRTNLFGIKIKALFTDLFAKLNIDANKLDGIQAGAEKNKNAFAKIKVGSSLILADNQEDTFEIVPGSNVIVTPDAINDKVTIGLPPSLDINVTGSAAKCNGCGEIMPTELTNSNEGSLRMSGFYQTSQGVANGSSAGTSYASIIQASRNNSRINRIILRGDTSKPLVYHQAYNENTWGPLTRFVMEGDNITGNAASATKLQTKRKINNVDFDGTANITITAAANGGTSAACSGNAATATKATQDSRGQQIDSTYIKGLSVNGRTVTYTRGNGTTGSFQTQDTNTTYTLASLGAPMTPTSSYWKSISISNGRFTLPSGGTWAYAAIARQSTNTMTILDNVGVAAGGTTIQTSHQIFSVGDVLVWRIA
ncbi:hypothetical protein [Pyramidobacter piscolens]|uniref:hypothetical protein n=1 Tax=Pyramidobacter piscolens TaxID=638849 RepID=UPI002AB1263B|nr:hypothetical protein [Pyramidobacter piscolens]